MSFKPQITVRHHPEEYYSTIRYYHVNTDISPEMANTFHRELRDIEGVDTINVNTPFYPDNHIHVVIEEGLEWVNVEPMIIDSIKQHLGWLEEDVCTEEIGPVR